MIRVALTQDAALNAILARHPMVEMSGESALPGLQFSSGTWNREIRINDPSLECSGLVELIDNNPMVCADAVSVPGLMETLALIALGPLAKAQLIVERPILLCNADLSEEVLTEFLRTFGWDEGAMGSVEELDFGDVLVLNALVKIQTPRQVEVLDELFDECYGRSFFVRSDQDSEWDIRLVAGHPHAVYRLVISEGEEFSLLRVQVMADRNGKAGAAQVVHAMNVMCGLEESIPFA